MVTKLEGALSGLVKQLKLRVRQQKIANAELQRRIVALKAKLEASRQESLAVYSENDRLKAENASLQVYSDLTKAGTWLDNAVLNSERAYRLADENRIFRDYLRKQGTGADFLINEAHQQECFDKMKRSV